MRSIRYLLAVVCIGAMVAQAHAQTPPKETPAAGESVISSIPGGITGFVVINNPKATAAKADVFLGKIGLAQTMKDAAPKGVLEFLKTQAKLGEGFNGGAGFAAVMLDPQQFGVDLSGMMSGRNTGKAPKVPFVLYVPGSSIKEVFGKYEMSRPEGSKYTLVELRMGPVYAAQLGGHIILSPMDKALDAVIDSKSKVATAISKVDAQMLASSDVGIYVNMKVAGPIYNSMLQQAEKQMESMRAMMSMMPAESRVYLGLYLDVVSGVLPWYREKILQMESVTCGMRMASEGVVWEERLTFQKDSASAKILASQGLIAKTRLDRLPNFNYVLAVEAAVSTQSADLSFLDVIFKSPALSGVSDQTKAKFKAVAKGMAGQVESIELVMGGAPKGEGTLAGAHVIHCKDSQKVKDLMSQGVEAASEIIDGIAKGAAEGTTEEPKKDGDSDKETLPPPTGDTPEANVTGDPPETQEAPKDKDKDKDNGKAASTEPAGVKVVYKKDAQKIGSVSVDEIVVNLPADTAAGTREGIKKILGSETPRLMVAALDDKTVIVTLGGSKAMMAEALKLAKDGGGTILSKSAEEAMKAMPRERSTVIMINVSNLLGLIKQIAPESAEIPTFTSTAPVVIGATPEGNSMRTVTYVPNEVIKDIVGAAMRAAGGGGDEGTEEEPTVKPKPKEDF